MQLADFSSKSLFPFQFPNHLLEKPLASHVTFSSTRERDDDDEIFRQLGPTLFTFRRNRLSVRDTNNGRFFRGGWSPPLVLSRFIISHANKERDFVLLKVA